MSGGESIPVVVVLGPTAVGKSSIAILLAEELDGEIVSADSRLIYHGMDIGTDKPTLAQRKRVPHHLIDVADPDAPWSVAAYISAAKELLREIKRSRPNWRKSILRQQLASTIATYDAL